MREEKKLDEKIAARILARGGMYLKMDAAYFAGLPDRLVILPRGKMFFVELKSPDGVVSELQKRVHAQLRNIGARVYVVKNISDIEFILDYIEV